MTLPIPPLEMRVLVGPTDVTAFDNPSGSPIFPELPSTAFERVFDFGCGCGRFARQLIQQANQPQRYVGIDLHRGMIRWCKANLTPSAPQFEFYHHDVFELAFNPDGATRAAPFPVPSADFTLVIAVSVFTHILPDEIPSYLSEVRRVLRTNGTAVTTWFLFDKNQFPMMQEEQNALYINPVNPTNAVIYDRAWCFERLEEADLVVAAVTPPEVRGHQWWLRLAPRGSAEAVSLPEDRAPVGLRRASPHGENAQLIGLEGTR